jgi:hypothetical protein
VDFLKAETVSRGWLALAGMLIVFEVLFLYEAMIADMGGYQRIFGVFAGLAILSFAALLYSISTLIYGWR